MKRPSHKELIGKLRAARKAVESGRVALLNQMALVTDAIEMDYSITNELNAALTQLLEGATPADYTGARPPQRSYEQDIQGLKLFAFSVESKRFKCRVYLKFAMAGEIFCLCRSIRTGRRKRNHEYPKLPKGPWGHGVKAR